MLQEFEFRDFDWTAFVGFNFAAVSLSAFCLAWLFVQRRYQFVKPSTLLLVYVHVLFQWPLAFFSTYIENWLPEPWAIAALVHGFVLPGIAVTQFSFNGAALVLWHRVLRVGGLTNSRDLLGNDGRLLLCAAIASAGIYLAYVPITSTGLFVLLTDPSSAVLAREDSLKLVSDVAPRYALSILAGTIAPLFTAVVAIRWYRALSPSWTARITVSLSIFLVWVLASLSGAKAVLIYLLLVPFAAVAWGRRLEVPIAMLLPAFLIALSPAIAVALVFALADPAQGGAALVEVIQNQFGAVLERVAVIPFEVGLWYVHFTQTEGPAGLGGFQRFASLVGAEPIDLANIIGLAYGPMYYGHEVPDSISATAGFIFSHYAYLGLLAVPLNLLLLVGTDLVLLVSRYTADRLIIAFLAAETVCVLKFPQSEYFTVWLTHGFGLIALAVVLLSSTRSRQSVRPVGATRG